MAITLFDYAPGAISTLSDYTVTWRFIIPAASLTAGTYVRVRIRLLYKTTPYVVRMYVGLRAAAGDVFDIDPATIKQLTKAESGNISVTGSGQCTDWVGLVVDGTRDLVVSHYGVSGPLPWFDTALSRKFRKYTSPYDWNLPADGTGFSEDGTRVYTVAAVEAEVARNVVVSALRGIYGLYESHLESSLVGAYHLMHAVSPAALVGVYGLVIEQAMAGRYGNAAAIQRGLIGRYGDSAALQSALVGRYGDLLPVLAALDGRYHLMHAAIAGLAGRYAVCGATVLSALSGRYDLRERNEIMTALAGYYSLLPGATIQQIVCPVRIGGVAVRWSSVSWTQSEDSYLVDATIVLRDPAEFGSIAKHDTVEIDWGGVTYSLFVAAKLRSRSVSGDAGSAEYGADYTIIARSLTAALDAPYALPVTMSWPATTLASAIASDLIALLGDLITLDWRLEDWLQPSGTFFVNDESPLEGLRKLAGIIGGIVQTSPDNAIILRMADIVPPAEWATVAPAWTIEDSGVFSDSESEQQSNRYNVITVSNQGESDRSTRFVVEDLADHRKQVKGYRVPWTNFGLATSGGEWVTIEDNGIVEELVADEIVEFVDGSSTSALPVYSQVSTVWLQDQLGAITAAEDGSLVAEVSGQSLARISYTTRCHVWIGTSDRDEEVQFYEVDL